MNYLEERPETGSGLTCSGTQQIFDMSDDEMAKKLCGFKRRKVLLLPVKYYHR